jgi:RHS repeat-associated protein
MISQMKQMVDCHETLFVRTTHSAIYGCQNNRTEDEETGLNYHWARYYALWLGRWVSADPLGIKDGINCFMYVNNNPLIYTDPLGERRYPVQIKIHGQRVEGSVDIKDEDLRREMRRLAKEDDDAIQSIYPVFSEDSGQIKGESLNTERGPPPKRRSRATLKQQALENLIKLKVPQALAELHRLAERKYDKLKLQFALFCSKKDDPNACLFQQMKKDPKMVPLALLHAAILRKKQLLQYNRFQEERLKMLEAHGLRVMAARTKYLLEGVKLYRGTFTSALGAFGGEIYATYRGIPHSPLRLKYMHIGSLIGNFMMSGSGKSFQMRHLRRHSPAFPRQGASSLPRGPYRQRPFPGKLRDLSILNRRLIL